MHKQPCAELKDQTIHIRIAGVDAPEVCVCLISSFREYTT